MNAANCSSAVGIVRAPPGRRPVPMRECCTTSAQPTQFVDHYLALPAHERMTAQLVFDIEPA